MRLLTNLTDESLWRGDILRLVHNYDLGPGSDPVDLMVYDSQDEKYGLSLMVVSGYKAGLTLSTFPKESCGEGGRSLETAWLFRNWNNWFVYSYHMDEHDRPVPIPLPGTIVVDWSEREIVINA